MRQRTRSRRRRPRPIVATRNGDESRSSGSSRSRWSRRCRLGSPRPPRRRRRWRSRSPSRPTRRWLPKARPLYAHHCSHCHGFNMVNPGTVTYDLRQFPHDDKARFVHSVTEGKNGRMPPWGDLLSRERDRRPVGLCENRRQGVRALRLPALASAAFCRYWLCPPQCACGTRRGERRHAASMPERRFAALFRPPRQGRRRIRLPDCRSPRRTARATPRRAMVRKQARRGFEHEDRSQCAAFGRPL